MQSLVDEVRNYRRDLYSRSEARARPAFFDMIHSDVFMSGRVYTMLIL